jgi:hypothetical protein
MSGASRLSESLEATAWHGNRATLAHHPHVSPPRRAGRPRVARCPSRASGPTLCEPDTVAHGCQSSAVPTNRGAKASGCQGVRVNMGAVNSFPLAQGVAVLPRGTAAVLVRLSFVRKKGAVVEDRASPHRPG